MKRPFIVLLSLCSSFLCAEPSAGTISSTHAEYDGNALILKGEVILHHGLGMMRAERATLEKQEAGKDLPFSFIHLEKEVLLHLKDNAKLSCEKADLNFISLIGTLSARENEKVTYTDMLAEEIPLQLMGKHVDLTMSKKPLDEKKNAYAVETVTALEDVTIHYNTDFTLKAHRAHYCKWAVDQHSSSEFPGFVTADPITPNQRCHLHHLGDLIDASQVQIDLIKEVLTLKQPKGKLISSLFPHPQNSEVSFQAESLTWERPGSTLTLCNQVHIEDSTLGEIEAENQLKIKQAKVDEKTVVQTITALGKTRFTYFSPHHTYPHVLISYGTLTIDRDTLRAILISPSTDGAVSSEQQVYYEEERIASRADSARVDYTLIDEKIVPTSLIMEGNIRLFSHLPNAPKRCALADSLHYNPEARTTILSALSGHLVLFWDEEQALHIAAQEIHITQDLNTKDETIKGIGSVKFSFTSEESHDLQQIFPFYKCETPHL